MTMQPRTGVREGDQRILDVLADGTPRSTREISDALYNEIWTGWANELGLEIEWGTEREPFGARILAHKWGEAHGYEYRLAHDVHPRLRSLERRGLVSRLQLEGHRPMLWQLARVEAIR